MAKKKPKLAELTWTMREVLDPGTPVGAVACVLGRVIMGGASLYRVVPGSWEVQFRALPEAVGWPLAIAMEPRPPYRVAVGPDTGDVVVFTDTTNATSIMGHPFTEQRGSKQAAELAWVEHEGQSSLFARTDDRMLYRMQAEGWDTLEVPPVHAIAQDDAGGFAALTVVDGNPKVYLTYDGGISWHLRPLGVDVEAAPDAPAALALAGTSVAAVVGDSGPMVSRAAGEPTTRHEGLERAYALAFQGMAPDAWLYVGVQRAGEAPASVWILADDGRSLKVMDFLADDHEPLDLGGIAWDGTRGALMVSSRGGLVAMGLELPKPKRARAKKKPLPQ
jgi:hypothetical protein